MKFWHDMTWRELRIFGWTSDACFSRTQINISMKKYTAFVTLIKELLHVTIFRETCLSKQIVASSTQIFTCDTPTCKWIRFLLHKPINRFLLSATNFFKLHNKKTCNMARVTCFVTLLLPTNPSSAWMGRFHFFQLTQFLFARQGAWQL